MIENLLSHLPHGKEIIAIENVIEVKPNQVICKLNLEKTEFDNSVYNAIEFIAQSAAVGRIVNSVGGSPKIGMILRVKHFHVLLEQTPSTVCCEWSDSVAGAYEVEGKVYTEDGQLMAYSVMTLMEQEREDR